MPTQKRKLPFIETEIGVEAAKTLQIMAADKSFNTGSSYSANIELHPDNTISFVEKHLAYLQKHPNTDVQHYLSNLRLMTRIK